MHQWINHVPHLSICRSTQCLQLNCPPLMMRGFWSRYSCYDGFLIPLHHLTFAIVDQQLMNYHRPHRESYFNHHWPEKCWSEIVWKDSFSFLCPQSTIQTRLVKWEELTFVYLNSWAPKSPYLAPLATKNGPFVALNVFYSTFLNPTVLACYIFGLTGDVGRLNWFC